MPCHGKHMSRSQQKPTGEVWIRCWKTSDGENYCKCTTEKPPERKDSQKSKLETWRRCQQSAVHKSKNTKSAKMTGATGAEAWSCLANAANTGKLPDLPKI